MKTKLRLGIIGAGAVVREIYRHLFFHSQYSSRLDICSVASPCESTHLWFGDLAGIPAKRRFADYREMLKFVGLDAVLVNTPDHLHCGPTMDALATVKEIIPAHFTTLLGGLVVRQVMTKLIYWVAPVATVQNHMKNFLLLTALLPLFISLRLVASPLDAFGVTKLCPTISGGREWFADWERERTIGSYDPDPADKFFFNEEGDLHVRAGVAAVSPGMTRLVVLTPTNAAGRFVVPQWTNVEMTIYARRGKASRALDYQAFYLSARSGVKHNDDVPCDGTSYHATARFDGQCGFKKEVWHTGGYTGLRPDPAPKPWPTVPEGQWIGMKFLCRNCDGGQHVRLQLYLDAGENNEWKLASEFTDAGGWRGEKSGCDRPQDFIITEGRPAVYFRTDYVAADLKKFSVREITPLP